MSTLAVWLVRLVVVLHVLIGLVEIFAGRRLITTKFGFPASSTVELDIAARIAANAGLYNLFVAIVAFWALSHVERDMAFIVLILCFVIVAGVFGAVTLRKPAVLVLQSIPATTAVLAIWTG